MLLQLYFDDASGLSAAQRHRHILETPRALPWLRGAVTTQQAMLVRRFPVPEPRRSPVMCSDLVAREGEADDPDAWTAHDTTHRTAIMVRFLRIGDIVPGTRLDWRCALPCLNLDGMLCTKVVFDDPPGLTTALHSPVRHEMRADYATCRKFTGRVTDFLMRTAIVDLSRVAGAVAQGRRRG